MCDEYLLTIDIDLLEVYIFGSTLGWQPNVFDEKARFSPLFLAAGCFQQLGHTPINTIAQWQYIMMVT